MGMNSIVSNYVSQIGDAEYAATRGTGESCQLLACDFSEKGFWVTPTELTIWAMSGEVVGRECCKTRISVWSERERGKRTAG